MVFKFITIGIIAIGIIIISLYSFVAPEYHQVLIAIIAVISGYVGYLIRDAFSGKPQKTSLQLNQPRRKENAPQSVLIILGIWQAVPRMLNLPKNAGM